MKFRPSPPRDAKRRTARLALALLCSLSLVACGTRGALVNPPGPAPEPLLGSGAAKNKAANLSTHANTAQETTR
ncbi:MAG: hypothetical protein RIR00_1335 [Pseudomonadota bacterium]|jgi:predicted small lipoprotein YifL